MWVQSLGQEDTMEEGTAIHSSTLAWRIPWTEEPRGISQVRILEWVAIFFLQGFLPDPGIKLTSPALQSDALPLGHQGSPYTCMCPRVYVVVQLLRRVRLFVTLLTAARQASLSFTISRSLLKLMSIESVMPFNHLILCDPLLLLPSVFPSIRAFSHEVALHIR